MMQLKCTLFWGETFRKGVGLELILDRVNPSRDATLLFCCDGKNDISLVKHFGESYRENHLVIAPSNASPVLKEEIKRHNKTHGQKAYVLENDCTTLGKEVIQILKSLKHI